MQNEWQPIETAPFDKWVILWFISINPSNKYAHFPVIGKVVYEIDCDGREIDSLTVWASDSRYKPFEVFSHWMPLPQPPEGE